MRDAIRWDDDLISRYDQAAPRYTSYPTAVQFTSSIGSFDLLHALRDSRLAARPLSLYVHVPFCENICHFCACNHIGTTDRSRAQPYLEHLEREIELLACHLSPEQPVEQLHFGGGTPTFLDHAQLRRLMAHLRRHFSLQDDCDGDYAIEIDPRSVNWATMGLLRDLGFNRICVGVQDLDPDVQRAINREQSTAQTRAVVDAARTLQFRSLSMDLIYGLPLQTPERFARTLDAVIEMQPDRLSLFNYAHLPERFPNQRRLDARDLPSPHTKLSMLRQSIERLLEAGYRHIGMDHFALPDDDLAMAQEDGTLQRNFQGYTTHGHCDLIGLGTSAISQLGDLYCQNATDLHAYQQLLDRDQLPTLRGLRCTADDRLRRAVIQRLICDFSLDIGDLEQRFGIDFAQYFHRSWPALQQMARDGLITLDARRLDVTPIGRLLIRAVCMPFDDYLPADPGQLYSKVI